MRRKRPCRVCRKWFEPHPRAGARQKVCGSPECQRERHRRACSAWHDRNPEYDRERRLRERIRLDPEPGAKRPAPNPLREVAWNQARDAVGLEVAVIVEETAEVLVSWTRDAVRPEALGIVDVSAKHGARAARDAIGPGGPSP